MDDRADVLTKEYKMQGNVNKAAASALGREIAEKTAQLAEMQAKNEPRQLTEAEITAVSGGRKELAR
jgi:hypothetical protein